MIPKNSSLIRLTSLFQYNANSLLSFKAAHYEIQRST